MTNRANDDLKKILNFALNAIKFKFGLGVG